MPLRRWSRFILEQTPVLLGNDIVDLQEASATGKVQELRFLERVFTVGEQECIRAADCAVLMLWMLWSGKESLFKVMSKIESGLVFSHKRFALEEKVLTALLSGASSGGKIVSEILFENRSMHLQWEWNSEYVHCVASDTEPGTVFSRVDFLSAPREGSLSAREEESVHSPESRKVRLLAKEILEERLFVQNPEIVRERESSRFRSPQILENGLPVPALDLSLSHDGRFVAAVVSIC